MIHLLGACLCAAGAVWLGLRGAARLRERAWNLRTLEAALALLEQELELDAPPLPRLLDLAAVHCRGAALQLVLGCREALNHLEERDFPTAWTKLVEDLPEVSREGKRCLDPLGAVLGRCDWEEQRRRIGAVRVRLGELARQAEEDGRRQGRLYRILGVSGGAFLVILLL